MGCGGTWNAGGAIGGIAAPAFCVSTWCSVCQRGRGRETVCFTAFLSCLLSPCFMFVCVGAIYTYVYPRACMHIIHTCIQVHACMHACMHTYIHTYGVYMVSPRVWPRRTSMRGALLFQAA